MNRKYLEDIIPKEKIFGYHNSDDHRHKRWCKQEKKYGFCDIETWDLDAAFAQIIYERLMMYKEIGGEVVDLTYHTHTYLGEEKTTLELIDMMIEKCKVAIKESSVSIDHVDIMDEVYTILKICHKSLWW